MNITEKTELDPVNDTPLSDAMLRWLLLAVEDVAGKQGVATILRQAKLERMIDNYPSESLNIKGQYTYEQYAQINTALLTFLGRGGRSVVMRAGRISFNKGLEHYGPMLGAATTAMKLLPEGTRLKAGLEAQKFFWDKLYKDAGLPTIGVKVEDHGDHFIFEFGDCMACAGKASDAPMCFLTVGYLQEGIKWLTGKDYEIREIACRSMGANACVYEINKTPKE